MNDLFNDYSNFSADFCLEHADFGDLKGRVIQDIEFQERRL